jgi:hypothetical protein
MLIVSQGEEPARPLIDAGLSTATLFFSSVRLSVMALQKQRPELSFVPFHISDPDWSPGRIGSPLDNSISKRQWSCCRRSLQPELK